LGQAVGTSEMFKREQTAQEAKDSHYQVCLIREKRHLKIFYPETLGFENANIACHGASMLVTTK
jgi:hypothetical protein